jgi:hypothetical protein
MAESKKAGSDLGIESAKQGIEDVAGTVQNAKLASVGMDKMVVKFKGHSYLAILRPITWYDADKLCKSLGGHLAYVASKEDMEFLQKLTRVGGVWVGASDENKEGDWRWTNGMTVMGSLWAHDRPYKAHGLNCAALQQDGLADLNCKDLWPVGFICQWD